MLEPLPPGWETWMESWLSSAFGEWDEWGTTVYQVPRMFLLSAPSFPASLSSGSLCLVSVGSDPAFSVWGWRCLTVTVTLSKPVAGLMD